MPVEKVSRQRYKNPDVAGGECAPRGRDIEEDFATYHEALARAHLAALHGPGVAAGFEAAATPDWAGVAVAAGVAVTPAGHLVVLPDADGGLALVGDSNDPVPVPIILTPPAPDGVFVLTARPAAVAEGGERCGRVAVTARLRLVPAAAFAPDPDAVVLGVVQMFRGKVIAVTDRNPAVRAAERLRTGEAAVLRQVETLAATVARLQQRVDELEARLAAHAADQANPHATTAAQAGALPAAGGDVAGWVNFGPPNRVPRPGHLQDRMHGVAVYNPDGHVVADLSVWDQRILLGAPKTGSLTLSGPTGKVGIRAVVGPDGGQIDVYDANGNHRSYLGSGVKPFVMPHPRAPGRQIIYAAVEGPEAGAYVRGRAALAGGAAAVAYPDHFALVVNPDTVTVTLTPRAAASRGLAVTATDAAGFRVRELAGGTGDYEFDYLAVGVRKGYEHYRTVVNVGENHFGESLATDPDPAPAAAVGSAPRGGTRGTE